MCVCVFCLFRTMLRIERGCPLSAQRRRRHSIPPVAVVFGVRALRRRWRLRSPRASRSPRSRVDAYTRVFLARRVNACGRARVASKVIVIMLALVRCTHKHTRTAHCRLAWPVPTGLVILFSDHLKYICGTIAAAHTSPLAPSSTCASEC